MNPLDHKDWRQGVIRGSERRALVWEKGGVQLAITCPGGVGVYQGWLNGRPVALRAAPDGTTAAEALSALWRDLKAATARLDAELAQAAAQAPAESADEIEPLF